MSAFGKAFNAARRAGKKTFTWQGKKYTTKMAADTPKKGPIPEPRSDSTKTSSVPTPTPRPKKTVVGSGSIVGKGKPVVGNSKPVVGTGAIVGKGGPVGRGKRVVGSGGIVGKGKPVIGGKSDPKASVTGRKPTPRPSNAPAKASVTGRKPSTPKAPEKKRVVGSGGIVGKGKSVVGSGGILSIFRRKKDK